MFAESSTKIPKHLPGRRGCRSRNLTFNGSSRDFVSIRRNSNITTTGSLRAAQSTWSIDDVSGAEDSTPVHDRAHARDAHPVTDQSSSRASRQVVKREWLQSISNRERRMARNSHSRSKLAPAQTSVSSRKPHHSRVSGEPKQGTASCSVARTTIRKLIKIICSITITELLQISFSALRNWFRKTIISTVQAKKGSPKRERQGRHDS